MLVIATAMAMAGMPDIYTTSAKTDELAEICAQTATRPLEANFCTGYVMATVDALAVNKVICLGPSATTIQVMAIARKYLADHPETWDRQPSYVLGEAFKSVFVCPWNMNWQKK